MGPSLRRSHGKRDLIPARKQVAHKQSGKKAAFLSLKEFQDFCSNKLVVIATGNTTVVACINKERSMRLVPVCLTVKNPDLGLQEMSNSQGLTHSSPAECGIGQAVQAGPGHSDRIVSDSSGLSVDMDQVAPTSNRPFCNEVQQIAPFCVTSCRLPSLGSRYTQSTITGPGPICLPTNSHTGKSYGETKGLPVRQENHANCSRVA